MVSVADTPKTRSVWRRCHPPASTLLRTRMSNATRNWSLVWRAPSWFSHVVAGRSRRSPSPQPSPLGRGSHPPRRSNIPEAPGSRTRGRGLSLSPRERVGVRIPRPFGAPCAPEPGGLERRHSCRLGVQVARCRQECRRSWRFRGRGNRAAELSLPAVTPRHTSGRAANPSGIGQECPRSG
jgi:hypothetical protein